jgi:8-oxo-dGTP pyrophosphatase MutT (NUDIX family)|tara:strand:- start:389 stop:1009 length:621 start_codon:yes stop_codon:yes gene_type:complete
MYKVFFNQKPLILTNEIQDFSDNEPLLFIKYTSVAQIIKALKSSKNRKVFLYHKDIDKLWKSFKKKFPIVEAAGGLVERTDNKLLFIFRNNKWDLPKGGVEKKELIIEAAQREVTEETGVSDLIVQKQLSETFHIFKKGKRFRLKKTYWFKMSTKYMGETIPQTEEGIKKIEWVSKEKIDEILNDAFENIRIIVFEVLKSDTLRNK